MTPRPSGPAERQQLALVLSPDRIVVVLHADEADAAGVGGVVVGFGQLQVGMSVIPRYRTLPERTRPSNASTISSMWVWIPDVRLVEVDAVGLQAPQRLKRMNAPRRTAPPGVQSPVASYRWATHYANLRAAALQKSGCKAAAPEQGFRPGSSEPCRPSEDRVCSTPPNPS
jgi:hypothetical protein